MNAKQIKKAVGSIALLRVLIGKLKVNGKQISILSAPPPDNLRINSRTTLVAKIRFNAYLHTRMQVFFVRCAKNLICKYMYADTLKSTEILSDTDGKESLSQLLHTRLNCM